MLGVVGYLLRFWSSWWNGQPWVIAAILVGVMAGLGLPHMVIGFMGNRRIKKFLASFPEAIDTMCRGLRSGLPVGGINCRCWVAKCRTRSGIEFHRISDSVRLGKSLEDAMWDVAKRLDTRRSFDF